MIIKYNLIDLFHAMSFVYIAIGPQNSKFSEEKGLEQYLEASSLSQFSNSTVQTSKNEDYRFSSDIIDFFS